MKKNRETKKIFSTLLSFSLLLTQSHLLFISLGSRAKFLLEEVGGRKKKKKKGGSYRKKKGIDKEEEELKSLKGMSVLIFLNYTFPNFHYILF